MSSSFVNTSPDCAICLDPLSTNPTLTLPCGHIYHVICLQQQLLHTLPSPSKRLIFSGTRCAQCQTPFHHPLLSNYAPQRKIVEQQVDQLITRQAEVDPLPPDVKNPLEWGRRQWAFFLCSLCEEPYFGGNVQCGAFEEAEVELEGEERLCNKCNVHTGRRCRDGRHWVSYIWKCRFCCSIASYVCRGNMHMCHDCHTKDRGRPNEIVPVQCLGYGNCKLGGLQAGEIHTNCLDIEGELMLGCGVCESGVGEEGGIGSDNFVHNASGERGLEGWEAMSWMGWEVEESNVRLGAGVNFVSGHSWCTMGYIVDLWENGRRRSEEEIRVEIGGRYMCRTDCPAVFKMEAGVFGAGGERMQWWESGETQAAADGWDRMSHVFEGVMGRFVMVVVSGKDERFWAGRYGAKVADVGIRVLGGIGVGWKGCLAGREDRERILEGYWRRKRGGEDNIAAEFARPWESDRRNARPWESDRRNARPQGSGSRWSRGRTWRWSRGRTWWWPFGHL